MKIRWLKSSLTNLETIHIHLNTIDPILTEKFSRNIEKSLNILSINPYIGRKGRVFGTRELVLNNFPYIIPYRVRDNEIQILRVLHTKQNQT